MMTMLGLLFGSLPRRIVRSILRGRSLRVRGVSGALHLTPACVLLCVPLAWADGPVLDPVLSCRFYFQVPADVYVVYLSQTKGIRGTQMRTFSLPDIAPKPYEAGLCPLTPGQYYYSVVSLNTDGTEGGESKQFAFVIPGTPPPPPVLAVGAPIQTLALLLNVRETPAGRILGTQPRGASGIIQEGPQVLNGVTWWRIHYSSGPDGWCSEGPVTGPYLRAVVSG